MITDDVRRDKFEVSILMSSRDWSDPACGGRRHPRCRVRLDDISSISLLACRLGVVKDDIGEDVCLQQAQGVTVARMELCGCLRGNTLQVDVLPERASYRNIPDVQVETS